MDLTFGIITAYEDVARLMGVVKSIKDLNIPNVEIIISGSYEFMPDMMSKYGVQTIVCNGWIPRKKNLVAKFARHETIVMLHDYYVFDPEWYKSYEAFGDDWDICSNPQFLMNGTRHFTDWVVWDDPVLPRYHSLCHDDWTHTKYQYISGGYFLVKRSLLRSNPINEEMQQGSPEDVEWSLRVRDKAIIRCNPDAIVRHNKVHRDCK